MGLWVPDVRLTLTPPPPTLCRQLLYYVNYCIVLGGTMGTRCSPHPNPSSSYPVSSTTVLCQLLYYVRWDYGYQMSAMANRTVLVDNNTWNNTHIATVHNNNSSSSRTILSYPIPIHPNGPRRQQHLEQHAHRHGTQQQ